MTSRCQGFLAFGLVFARPILAPMEARLNSPMGAGGSLTIQALLNPMYQLASSPPSANLPKSLIFGFKAKYVGRIVLVDTVDNLSDAHAMDGMSINADIRFIIIF
ncbi:MAG: hypothetical protein PHU21_07005 [Elusimicrobia bacterium]|nr:hypothetical protein [Elusimicrobiota bacterium]